MRKTESEIQALQARYPAVPAYAIPKTKKKKSNPTNQLTADVMDYVRSKGAMVARINSQGTYSEALGKYIKSGSTNGVSDVIACFKGRLICIEVKRAGTRDKMRPDQIRFQLDVTKAGGHYIIASDIDTFRIHFDRIIETV